MRGEGEGAAQASWVRAYSGKPLGRDVLEVLAAEVEACNREGDLHIQLVVNEPQAFAGMMARYGKFSSVGNYLALVGKRAADLDERLGYYGERLVILAQELGLNTCWVAMSFSKGKCAAQVDAGEKLVLVIALGYGATQGKPRPSKPMEALCALEACACGTAAFLRDRLSKKGSRMISTPNSQTSIFPHIRSCRILHICCILLRGGVRA